MILQSLELPQPQEKSELQELYIRTGDSYTVNETGLVLGQGAVVSLDTYFNSFSIEKWLKYTNIDQLSLEIAYAGKLQIKVYGDFVTQGNKSQVREIMSTIVDSDGLTEDKYSIELPLEMLKGARICFAELSNIGEKKAIVYHLDYITKCEPINDVHLAISICTFKREDDLYRNISLIENGLVKNKESALYNNLDVLIVDNGHTVSVSEQKSWLTIIKNKNCGGAAGFSRGMMEISHNNKYSHILLMDDDVVIKPSAIEKTYLLLVYIRKEFAEYIIGGAMFRRDFPFIQHEAGGRYENGRIESLKNGKDLRNYSEVVANEEIVAVDYNAWWYCCIPIKIVNEKGYALPLFIHQDDIEYGIRAGRHVLTLNGIAVWHESFEQKRPSSNEYYDVRNILIVNSAMSANYKIHIAVRRIAIRMLTNAFRYRYRDVRLIAKAVDDFCKGPQWLQETDAEELNGCVRSLGYSYNEIFSDSNLVTETISLEDVMSGFNNSQKLDKKKLLLLNGNLLPAKTGKEIVPIPAGHSPHEFYRVKKAWIYDPDTQKGFYVNKDNKEFWTTIGLIICKSIKLTFNYKRMRREYSEAYESLRSDKFWRSYLGL